MLAVLFVVYSCVKCKKCRNYKNPEIQRLQQTMCKDISCGFGQVCEIKNVQCVRAPCPPLTQCVQTGGALSKGGTCPKEDNKSAFNVQCFGDFGCGISNNDVCCHNRNTNTSYCHTP